MPYFILESNAIARVVVAFTAEYDRDGCEGVMWNDDDRQKRVW